MTAGPAVDEGGDAPFSAEGSPWFRESWLWRSQPSPGDFFVGGRLPELVGDTGCFGLEDQGRFQPHLCCQPPRGFRACWDGELSYARCCASARARRPSRVEAAAIPFHGGPSAVPPAPAVKVDLVVRSWHRDMALLEGLLVSISIFWPFGRLRTTVVVVLDSEAPETAAACQRLALFGSWVRCVGEALPELLGSGTPVKRPRFSRVHWSTFWADRYASQDADFVGVLDADVVFHSFGAESFLFAPPSSAGGALRPVISGTCSATFGFSALAVRSSYFGVNFMDTLPFIVRRTDFAALRMFIRRRFSSFVGSGGLLSFDEAYVLADQHVNSWATILGWFNAYQGESLTFHAAMGIFVWEHAREHYLFSIQDGAQLGLPDEATCPTLRVALHATNLKRAAWDQPSKVSYSGEARGVMAAGLCAAAEAHRRLSPRDADACAALRYRSGELLRRPDDVGTPPWRASSTSHCGRRALARLMADQQQLLAQLGPGHSLALLRWALAGNASGRYDLNARGPGGRLEVFDQAGRE